MIRALLALVLVACAALAPCGCGVAPIQEDHRAEVEAGDQAEDGFVEYVSVDAEQARQMDALRRENKMLRAELARLAETIRELMRRLR